MRLLTAVSLYGGGPGSGCHGPNCGRPLTQGQFNKMVGLLRQQGLLRRRGITTGQVISTYNAWLNSKEERDRLAKENKQAGQKVSKTLKTIPKTKIILPNKIDVQPPAKRNVKTQFKTNNGTLMTVIKPKGQYEKTNKSWLAKPSPFKGQFQRLAAMDHLGDNKTKNSTWLYRGQTRGQMLTVTRNFTSKTVYVKETDTRDFDFITRTRIAQFRNIGQASGFMNRRYGITFRLGGAA